MSFFWSILWTIYELTQQLVAGKTEPIFFTSVWSVLLTHPSTPTSLLLRLINVVLTFIPFEGPDTMKHVALDCNKALYGVFAVWKLLWKLTCSIIRNYLEFSASFSFICDSGRNQHVETKNVLSYTAVLSTKITKPYPFNFSKAAAFLNFKFVLWAAKPHDLYLLNYKFTVIYWSTFANFHIYSSVFWSLMMKSALWWINLKPQFLIMF